jgi:hypothetical protein
MCRPIVISSAIALALLSAFATRASAQNPFTIDEYPVTDANNSGVAPGALKTIDASSSAKGSGRLTAAAQRSA